MGHPELAGMFMEDAMPHMAAMAGFRSLDGTRVIPGLTAATGEIIPDDSSAVSPHEPNQTANAAQTSIAPPWDTKAIKHWFCPVCKHVGRDLLVANGSELGHHIRVTHPLPADPRRRDQAVALMRRNVQEAQPWWPGN
ncbi:hypothetical protein Slin14017_G123130 [Septoria linicola]|nr:hypothetical protein Slin14017_G123130 [Septoria linicola]